MILGGSSGRPNWYTPVSSSRADLPARNHWTTSSRAHPNKQLNALSPKHEIYRGPSAPSPARGEGTPSVWRRQRSPVLQLSAPPSVPARAVRVSGSDMSDLVVASAFALRRTKSLSALQSPKWSRLQRYFARTMWVARSVGTCSTVRYPSARRSMPLKSASPWPSAIGAHARWISSTWPA